MFLEVFHILSSAVAGQVFHLCCLKYCSLPKPCSVYGANCVDETVSETQFVVFDVFSL